MSSIQKEKRLVVGWSRIQPALVILAMTFALNFHHLQGGWRFDDGHHLLFLARHANFEYLYDRASARLQSGSHLTPFNILTYDIPHRFFSFFEPGAFYAFHLLLVAAAGTALHAMLRSVASSAGATVGTATFLAGFPLLGIAGQLMVGHYVLGALFVSLALLHYNRSVLTGEVSKTSVLFYFLACVSKEIFVPFAALLAVDPRVKFSTRIQNLKWYALAAAVYWGIRVTVLGQVVGGYNRHGELLAAGKLLLQGVLSYFTAASSMKALGLMCCLVIISGLVQAYRRFGVWPVSIGAAGVAAAAFVPLLAVPAQVGIGSPTEIRLWLGPWYFLACATAFAADLAKRRLPLIVGAALAAIGFVILCAQFVYYQRHSPIAGIERDFDAVSRYVESGPKCNLVDRYGWSSWVHDLSEALHPGSSKPLIAPRAILGAYAQPGSSTCELQGGRVVRSDQSVPARQCSTADPLSVSILADGANVSFSFGPDKQGSYFVEVVGRYFLWIPSGFFGPMPNPFRFESIRVLRTEGDDHVVCSPVLQFRPLQAPELHYEQ